jgi:hypothetical protein
MAATYVGSCDSDAVLAPDYLIYIAIELESAFIVPRALGGCMTERYTDTLADGWRNIHLSQDTGSTRKFSDVDQRDTLYLPGCNTVLHRETALSLGGYDETHVAVGEDGQMNRLLHRNGHALLTTPLARCHHLRRDTPPSALRTRWNYEREAHAALRGFDTLGQLIRLLESRLDAAQEMLRQDQARGLSHLFPMEVLYVYAHAFLSAREGRIAHDLALGYEHWLQRALLGNTLRADSPAVEKLRAWRDAELTPWRLPADTPLWPPPAYYRERLEALATRLDQWVNATLLAAPNALSAIQ